MPAPRDGITARVDRKHQPRSPVGFASDRCGDDGVGRGARAGACSAPVSLAQTHYALPGRRQRPRARGGAGVHQVAFQVSAHVTANDCTNDWVADLPIWRYANIWSPMIQFRGSCQRLPAGNLRFVASRDRGPRFPSVDSVRLADGVYCQSGQISQMEVEDGQQLRCFPCQVVGVAPSRRGRPQSPRRIRRPVRK